MQQIQHIPLDSIDIYGGTQARVKTNEEAIDSYAEEMAAGAVFPPISVYFDGATYWLADGFHRYLATKRNRQIAIAAEIQPGGRIEALKHALGANVTNGVYRNNHDKRNAVEIALEEWSDRSNSYIADICKVSVELVRSRRKGLEQSGRIEKPERITGRDGKQYASQIEREPSGGEPAGVERESGGSSAGAGGGGGGRKGKGDGGAFGGSGMELERDARKMIHTGEINPFELPTLMSADAHDYAITVINLLGTMKPSDPKRRDGLLRIRGWIDKALAGVVEDAGAADEQA
ncbi:MAG: chromosome partitioning protein ParB [Verrucomicrobiota bacterium]